MGTQNGTAWIRVSVVTRRVKNTFYLLLIIMSLSKMSRFNKGGIIGASILGVLSLLAFVGMMYCFNTLDDAGSMSCIVLALPLASGWLIGIFIDTSGNWPNLVPILGIFVNALIGYVLGGLIARTFRR